MNPLSQTAKSLVRVIREASAKPFYSPIDKAISEIVQTKGTGEQMLAQILKTKGAAKELKERPAIKAALQQPKITKAELEKIAAENPPPSIMEKVDKGPSEVKYKVEHDDLNDKYDVVDDYSNVVKSFRDYDDAQFYAGKLEGGTTRHEQWQLPGGKNYREIKLMLPSFRPSIKNMDRKEYNEAIEAADKMGIKDFQSSHFSEPNILAHARVSDRTGPNGEKILHVEEIQSDWHQKGRKEGYRDQKENVNEKKYDEYVKDLTSRYQDRIANTYAPNETDPLRRSMQIPQTLRDERDPQKIAESMGELDKLQDMFALMYQERSAANKGVPDAPFKQNWHELVMKRLLDDAAKKGYDKVVITPGAEQAKRYNLSKYIDSIELHPNEFPNKDSRPYYFIAYNKNQERVADDTVSEKELENYIGKDLANKLLGMEPNKEGGRYLEGANLVSGGEGMKGFYDQMLPAFLNDYGKKWGARVGSYDLPDSATPVHSFDITPQMREDIVGKGQPLYQAIPAGVGAGTLAAPQEEVPEQPMKKGGAVHLSEGGEPETPEQQFERYLRMLRINASGGKDKYGSSVGGRFGVNIPVAKDVFIEPFVQGFAFKPDTGKLMSGGVGGANLNIRFKNGGDVSEDAMRMAVMNKQLRKRHG